MKGKKKQSTFTLMLILTLLTSACASTSSKRNPAEQAQIFNQMRQLNVTESDVESEAITEEYVTTFGFAGQYNQSIQDEQESLVRVMLAVDSQSNEAEMAHDETNKVFLDYDQIDYLAYDQSIGTTIQRLLTYLDKTAAIDLNTNHYFELDDTQTNGFVSIKIYERSETSEKLVGEYYYDITSGEITN
ncbi:hypothetical protein [Fundicoccus culcitae]|uniref:DUF5067 domain-containing protein n=1 Tax=Fundicoccus culcitae TaxID=2969821 RepID=A0ABY5P777_9LACT|nr:hypothetical protein [Fundicoccus culcitae]UUX34450.1 hypothetical protein NRE15_02025 [Fundicoccus culcitae]